MHVYTGTQLHRKMIAHNDTATTYFLLPPFHHVPSAPSPLCPIVQPIHFQLLHRKKTRAVCHYSSCQGRQQCSRRFLKHPRFRQFFKTLPIRLQRWIGLVPGFDRIKWKFRRHMRHAGHRPGSEGCKIPKPPSHERRTV